MEHRHTVSRVWLALRATRARLTLFTLGVALAAAFAGNARADGEPVTGSSWLLVTTYQAAPAQELQDAIGRIGGTIVKVYPEIGTLVVEASDASFRSLAAALPGVSSVLPNMPLRVVEDGTTAGDDEGPALAPADEPFYPFQWGLDAIHVQGAWDAGFTGTGARVAVLDTNFDLSHPDLAPNIDAALARSFVPGEEVTPPPGTTFSHGTFVAGIIAATANGVGTVGVAPTAQLIPIKVVGNAGGILLPWFLDGVNHAIAAQADVVNMSFNVQLPRAGGCFPPPFGCLTAGDVRNVAKLVQRAVRLARRHGITLVAAAGNASSELDRHDDLLWLPAETRGVLAVSALGPIDWALDQSTDLDVPEPYTNYGKKVIAFSGPGGIIGYPPGPTCDLGLDLGAGPIPCRWFDKVLSTNFPGSYQFGGGTSFAAPHVVGVAALVIGKHRGAMSPGLVQAILRKSADDLGPRGRDAFFGWGRVNAENAIRMTPE
jgi:subtilisin family serine protease